MARKKPKKNHVGARLKDIILGGQDGLVNVLGLTMGVAAATFQTRIILIAGLAGTFAESISMAAVAYTSVKTAKAYYTSEIRHHRLRAGSTPEEYHHPLESAGIVGISAVIGSLIPLLPFFFLEVSQAIPVAWVISALALFGIGAYKAKLTVGDWKKSGMEMALIGIIAAFAGYLIGRLLGVAL